MTPTSENKIFAGITAEGLLDIGASSPIAPSANMSHDMASWSTGRSAAITFFDDVMPLPNQELQEPLISTAEKEIRKILSRIDSLISERSEIYLTVVAITADEKFVLFEPCDEELRNPAFIFQISQKQLKVSTNSHLIVPGKIFEARITSCQMPFVSFVCTREVDIKATQARLTPRQTVVDELLAQPYPTFVQIYKGKESTYINKEGKEVESIIISTKSYADLCSMPADNWSSTFDNGSTMMLITSNSKGRLIFDNHFGKVAGLPYSPENPEKYLGDERQLPEVTGTVHSFYNGGKNLLEMIFDEGGRPWRSGVFVRATDGSLRIPFPVIEAAKKYICIGYPCRVRLCINPYDHSKSHIRLEGLSAQLEGRLASTIAINRLQVGLPLPVAHPMAPACRVGDKIMMVSADYTAFMPIDDALFPLVKMAEEGIFTPRFKIPCRLELVSDAPHHFQVVCKAVKKDWYSLHPEGSAIENVEICCSVGGRVILLADGCPAMTDKLDHDTLVGILKGHIKAEWRVKKPFDITWLHLSCKELSIDTADVMANGLTLGSLFELGSDGTYRGRKVISVPENKADDAGTLMMILGNDEKTGNIVATSEFALFTNRAEIGIQRMRVLPDLLSFGIVVAECNDERLTAYNMHSRLERLIFQRLFAIYGNNTTALMRRDKAFKLIRSEWTGVACQHDYSAIINDISGDIADLWNGLDDNTPVLFGDITLCRSEIPALTPFQTPEEKKQAAEPAVGSVGTVSVADSATDTVTVWLGGTRFAKNLDREALRLPKPATRRQLMSQFPIDTIFAKGDRWRMDLSTPEHPRIYAHTDETPRVYTVVARINDTDWAMRSDDGAIAVADSLVGAQPGDRVLMRLGYVLGSVVYVDEAEENFIGRKVRLQITELHSHVAICRDISNSIKRRIELPLDKISWNPNWTPSNLPIGTVLKACIVDVEPDRLVVDRRLLLRQDALYPGINPEPGTIYQMEVVGISDAGYLLQQNGVELVLPFDKAAVFDINVFNESYLQNGDLIAVKVENDGKTANWKATKTDDIYELEQHAGETLLFTIHHHSPDGVFLQREGIMMFLPNRQLGRWAGQPLTNEFPVGDNLEILVQPVGTGLFEATCRNPAPLRPCAPKADKIIEGEISFVYPGIGAYVDCGNGVPVYIEADSFADADVQMLACRKVALKVNNINTDQGIVTGVVAGNIDAPAPEEKSPEEETTTEQVFADEASNTNLGLFGSIVSLPNNEVDWAVLADRQGNEGIFLPTENMPLEKLRKYIADKSPVFAISQVLPNGKMILDFDSLIAPRQRMIKTLQEDIIVVKAKVVDHCDNGAIVLQHGMNVLIMPTKECKFKPDAPWWANHYAPGTYHRVLVYSTSSYMAFSASDTRL